jgi:cobalamin-dependent methionine synthase I
MTIEGLRIIGEAINDSVRTTKKLFEDSNFRGIIELAEFQEKMGAEYIDVNIGQREPGFMAEIVKLIQEHVSIPLSIDSPDIDIMRAGLEAYDPAKAGGKKPLVNSITESRMEMFDLCHYRSVSVVLIGAERKEGGRTERNRTGEDVLNTVKRLIQKARSASYQIGNNDLFIDPGIAPIAVDTEGVTKVVLDGIRLIRRDPDLKGVHLSVGLSNFSAMLPPQKSDGTRVKIKVENAFLTLAIPLGLDYIIGSVVKDYRLLNETDPAYQAVVEAIGHGGLESIKRIREFYEH